MKNKFDSLTKFQMIEGHVSLWQRIIDRMCYLRDKDLPCPSIYRIKLKVMEFSELDLRGLCYPCHYYVNNKVPLSLHCERCEIATLEGGFCENYDSVYSRIDEEANINKKIELAEVIRDVFKENIYD